MENWKHNFIKAKYYLSKHRPGDALRNLEEALAGCPVSRGQDLSKILFFLGIALRKLGLPDSAIKSWSAGSRVDRHGSAAKMLKRFQNEYGMRRQNTPEEDDWNAFYAIQLNRYVRGKGARRVGTLAERDMINDLIRERFLLLREEYRLHTLRPSVKYRLFHSVIIIFPRITAKNSDEQEPVQVNFLKKERMNPDDSCFCGSGLPFMQCCGRSPGIQEALNGLL